MSKKIIRDFAPTSGNARNSEGAFYKMDDGTIAFAYSRYRGGDGDDDAKCDLAISFSYDDGKTFSDGRVMLTLEECDAHNLMSVSFLKMNDGQIGMFYLKKTVDKQCRMFLRRTTDFQSFSEETQCIKDEGYFVVNNDRVVRLKNGRIVIPSAYVSLNGAVARFYASDDDGHTFYEISRVERPYEIMTTGLQEPGIIELDDKIAAYCRNNLGRQYIFYSTDGCKTWTTPVPSRFVSPISPLSTKKLSNGTVVAVYNPVPFSIKNPERVKGAWTGGRTPLLLSLCKSNLDDEYKTILLEDDPERGYCYVAIQETKDSILLGYCAGGVEDGCALFRLRITSVSKEDL